MPNFTCPRCQGSTREPASMLVACQLCGGAGVRPDEQLGPHFLLSELLASQTASRRLLPNDPPPDVRAALGRLVVELLEPLRNLAGPLHVDSGYRASSVNTAVGGALRSAHETGFAADLKPLACSMRRLIDFVRASSLPFDQVIWEYGSWIHVGLVGPGGVQRRQALMVFARGGYLPFDPGDSRVEP